MDSYSPPLIGVSKSIERVRDLIRHVADTGLNIVITGESGVGKEVVAHALYFNSSRRGKAFIKINCAALPEGLLESELFGYEQGAFTGAGRKKRGKFELANDGILFLDEIGDMSLPLQAKLLHVLQNGEFSPLGSEKETRTDSWVIAATNHRLDKSIKEGTFREDLYYRLNIINIHIPPLRQRPEDIPSLIKFYMEKYTSQFDKKDIVVPPAYIFEKLESYPWPGNVRELQNILKRLMVIQNWDEIIDELFLHDTSSNPEPGCASPRGSFENFLLMDDMLPYAEGNDISANGSFSLKKTKKKAMDKIEKKIIAHVLSQTGWNRSKASRILKISYKTLLYKISELNIIPPPD
ncbi:MAG: sigma-54 dependent transcriptional regulator [Desulfobacterales bacterium]|nr:sigma-54 dependent transcriptional regulator [Desulfobacterales bacterium]MDD4070779.1 sigma-54 dependent transcriptional regulator [Desulfobacterales bacterium]MDD4391181.1 sigma-54 dependent transcriptional regulator [Desulfobacterales bacterium]